MDDLVYRSAGDVANITRDKASSTDEANLNTLILIRDYLGEVTQALYKDFNAFDVLSQPDPDSAAKSLLTQIRGKQEAHGILQTAFQHIDSVVKNIDPNR